MKKATKTQKSAKVNQDPVELEPSALPEKANFGGFSDDQDYDLDVESRWSYPGMGYNATEGQWFINEEVYEGPITLQILAPRRRKYVVDAAGNIHSYPINTPKNQMVTGVDNAKTHIQFVVRIPDLETEESGPALFTFGSEKYTPRQAFWNNRSGRFRDERFATGIWYQLEDHVQAVQEKYGEKVPFYAWNVTIKPEEGVYEIASGDGKAKSKIKRIVLDHAFGIDDFIGEAMAFENRDLIADENLQEWADEWNKNISVQERVEEAEEAEAYDDDDDDFDEL